MLNARDFVVQLVISSTHEYNVVALDEEEAIAQAEADYGNGEFGEVLDYDVEMADAFPTDEDPEDEEDFD